MASSAGAASGFARRVSESTASLATSSSSLLASSTSGGTARASPRSARPCEASSRVSASWSPISAANESAARNSKSGAEATGRACVQPSLLEQGASCGAPSKGERVGTLCALGARLHPRRGPAGEITSANQAHDGGANETSDLGALLDHATSARHLGEGASRAPSRQFAYDFLWRGFRVTEWRCRSLRYHLGTSRLRLQKAGRE